MRRPLVTASLALALALPAALSSRAQETPATEKPAAVKAGDAAPGFELQDSKGALRKLSEWKGKYVVLWFYPKADTKG